MTTLEQTENGPERPFHPHLIRLVPPSMDAKAKQVQAQFEAYWSAQSHGGSIPCHSQFDPRGIEAALEFAFVIERVTKGEARIRVGGRHLTQMMGMEVRAMPLSAMFAPSSRQELAHHMAALFDAPCRVRAQLATMGQLGAGIRPAQMQLLPLRGTDGQVNRAVGYIISTGRTSHPPHRLHIVRMELLSLWKMQGSVPKNHPNAQSVADRQPKPIRQGPKLQLVKND